MHVQSSGLGRVAQRPHGEWLAQHLEGPSGVHSESLPVLGTSRSSASCLMDVRNPDKRQSTENGRANLHGGDTGETHAKPTPEVGGKIELLF